VRKYLTAPLMTAVVCSTLVGCTPTGSPDGPSPTPTSTSRAQPTPNPTSEITRPPLEQAAVPCESGEAHVEGLNNKEVRVPDCASVVVDSSNAVVHLGATERLTVHGAINGIDAASLTEVVITGDGNRVTTSSKPTVEDDGRSNTVGP
jgi:hypothetical protein